MPVEELPIDGFVVDPRLQCRESVNEAHVHELMDAMADGVALPPGVAFRATDGTVRLVEGYHRREAYRRSGKAAFPCEVKPGNEVAAVQAAAAANKSHGLKRTNDDKRKAVNIVLDLPECFIWTDARVAKHVGVSLPMVVAVRGVRAKAGEAQPSARVDAGGRSVPSERQEAPPQSQPQLSTIYNKSQMLDSCSTDEEGDAASSAPPPPADDGPPPVELGPAAAKHAELGEAWKKAKYGLADFTAALRNFARAVGPHSMPLNEWERTANAWLAKAGEEFSRRSRELSNAKAKKPNPAAAEAVA